MRTSRIRRLHHTVAPGRGEARLDAVVLEWLGRELGRAVSKSTVRRLIVAGAVRTGTGPLLRPAMTLPPGTRLRAVIDMERLPPDQPDADAAHQVRVLFEDEALIAVAKPAGLAVHPTADASRPDVYSLVKREFLGTGRYLGLHQRLDRDTSGIVLFTKRVEANRNLAAQFEGREVAKVYHALTIRPPREHAREWRVRTALAQAGKGRLARTRSVDAGGQPAETAFVVLETFPAGLLVEARPKTGRKHQIRAHLEESGLPILGDARYGGPVRAGGVQVPRAMLHARRLAFRHPLTGAAIEIDCEYPADFQLALSALRAARGRESTRHRESARGNRLALTGSARPGSLPDRA